MNGSRQYRLMVRQTMRVRRLAAGRYGYRMGWRGRLALAATWCAQFVPPRLARGLFERGVLGRTALGDIRGLVRMRRTLGGAAWRGARANGAGNRT